MIAVWGWYIVRVVFCFGVNFGFNFVFVFCSCKTIVVLELVYVIHHLNPKPYINKYLRLRRALFFEKTLLRTSKIVHEISIFEISREFRLFFCVAFFEKNLLRISKINHKIKIFEKLRGFRLYIWA